MTVYVYMYIFYFWQTYTPNRNMASNLNCHCSLIDQPRVHVETQKRFHMHEWEAIIVSPEPIVIQIGGHISIRCIEIDCILYILHKDPSRRAIFFRMAVCVSKLKMMKNRKGLTMAEVLLTKEGLVNTHVVTVHWIKFRFLRLWFHG